MDRAHTSRITPSSIALVVLIAVAVYQAVALNAAPAAAPAPISPTVVVTVDLEKIFNNVNLRQDAQTRVQDLAKELEAKRQAKIKEARDAEQDLETLAEGTPKYEEVQKRAMQAAMEAKALMEWTKLKLDFKSGEGLRAMYNDIRKGLATFAGVRGFDIILLNDAARSVDKGGKDDVTQQISARRVLFVRQPLDVTDQFIEWINAQPKPAN